jgi:hypothetical protein
MEDGGDASKDEDPGSNSLGQGFNSLKINDTTKTLLLASWRQGTHKQYLVYIRKWERYCKELGVENQSPKLETVMNFLSSLFQQGLGYSAINTARSALSTFIVCDGKTVGTHPLVIRMLKGIFNRRPSLPRNNVTWDPQVVMSYVKTMSPVANLSLLALSQKTATLLLLLTGQRGQSIHLIDIRNISVSKNAVKIRFGDVMKTTRPGFQQKEISIKAYAPDRRLCIVTVLTEYLERTRPLRQSTGLFISTLKPYARVSRDTISRWVKAVMGKAGLDLKIFTPHSVRGASTSAAARANVPLQSILETAGWSRDSTFRKYYDKPLKEEGTVGVFVLK